jgi:hypothetical protein
MTAFYAVNARRLLDDRKAGLVPAAPVSVVLGRQSEPGALYVKPDMPVERLDWRMLVNLQVWLWASPEVALRTLAKVARAIAAVRPARLTVRMEEGGQVHDVDVGHGLHTPAIADAREVHEFTWTPMDLSLTPTGAQLRRVLLAEMPMWSPL